MLRKIFLSQSQRPTAHYVIVALIVLVAALAILLLTTDTAGFW